MNKSLVLVCVTAFLMGPVLNACCTGNNCQIVDSAYTTTNPNSNLIVTPTCTPLPQGYSGIGAGAFTNNGNCCCCDLTRLTAASPLYIQALKQAYKTFLTALSNAQNQMNQQAYKDQINAARAQIQQMQNFNTEVRAKIIAFYDELANGSIGIALKQYIDNVRPCLQQLFTVKHNLIIGLCTNIASDFVSGNGYVLHKNICKDIVPFCAKAHFGLQKYTRAVTALVQALMPNYTPPAIDELLNDIQTCANDPTNCKTNTALLDRICVKFLPSTASSPMRVLEDSSDQVHHRLLEVLQPFERLLQAVSNTEPNWALADSNTALRADTSSPNHAGYVSGDTNSSATIITNPEGAPSNTTSFAPLFGSIMAFLLVLIALLN